MNRFQRLMVVCQLAAACSLTSSCASPPNVFPEVDSALTPGIFLDLGSKAALPPGVQLRPVASKGLAMTKLNEGWRSRLYNDVAHFCSIGYGHLVKRAPCNGTERADWLDGMTEAEGEALLVKDMADAQTTVMLAVTTSLNDSQYAVLCDFVFNVGGDRFRASRLLDVVNAGQHDQVANQLRRWTIAGGRQVEGLRLRREREIDLYYADTLTPKAAPPVGEDMSPLDIRTGR